MYRFIHVEMFVVLLILENISYLLILVINKIIISNNIVTFTYTC